MFIHTHTHTNQCMQRIIVKLYLIVFSHFIWLCVYGSLGYTRLMYSLKELFGNEHTLNNLYFVATRARTVVCSVLCSCCSGWNQFTISTHLSLCLHADVPFQQAMCVCDLYLHTAFIFIQVFSQRCPVMLFSFVTRKDHCVNIAYTGVFFSFSD